MPKLKASKKGPIREGVLTFGAGLLNFFFRRFFQKLKLKPKAIKTKAQGSQKLKQKPKAPKN
jgi:hypothetical protein